MVKKQAWTVIVIAALHGSFGSIRILFLPLFWHLPSSCLLLHVLHVCALHLVSFAVLLGHLLERVLFPLSHGLPPFGALPGEHLENYSLSRVSLLVLIPAQLNEEGIGSHFP